MANYSQSGNCIKTWQYMLTSDPYNMAPPEYKFTGNILKWYNVKMSYEEKYRFGVLTYEEYCAWQYELMCMASGTTTQNQADALSEDEHFWDSDANARLNLSQDDYSSFLANNNIDVSNNTTLNMDELLKNVPEALIEATPAPETDEIAMASSVSDEVDLNAVLRNVTRDIHGETFLSQAEIDAMFAAANN